VESCGQCTPCKLDGLALSDLFEKMCASNAGPADFERVQRLVDTVGDRARCSLATQQQVVIGSILERFRPELEAHVAHGSHGATAKPVAPMLVAELEDIEGDEAVWDVRHRQKQPDWTYTEEWSGKVPAEMYGDHRHQLTLPE
jgi:NADH-ubiquinone oxidoreductase-F iron-sulfur binding region